MLGYKNSHFSHNVPTKIYFFVLGKFVLEKNNTGATNKTQKRSGSVCGLMEFAWSWVMAGAKQGQCLQSMAWDPISNCRSQQDLGHVCDLPGAKYNCFCRIQIMNLALLLPPSSLNSKTCSQQNTTPSGIPCSARMLPGHTVQRQSGLVEWPAAWRQ